MREISAVTIWGELDALILDMPPGLGDELLDILRFVPRSEMIVVTTPSVLSLRVAERLVRFLAGTETEAVGAVLNMESGENRPLQTPAGIPLLCAVPYVGGFEKEIGKPSLLTEGRFAEHMVEGLTALQLF
jgi:ATP-binding protein involved in chromosome partitioning